jgi:two-component system, sensor histidine kinase and response regulator
MVQSELARALSSLPPAPSTPRPTLLAPVSATPAAPAVERPRVVVADPDPAARARVVRMLRDICDVEEAVDGLKAAVICASGRVPALLITDITTSQIDGFALAKLVKNHPTLKRVPVVFLSAKASPRDVVVAISLGARQFINKESSEQEISAKLRKIVAV